MKQLLLLIRGKIHDHECFSSNLFYYFSSFLWSKNKALQMFLICLLFISTGLEAVKHLPKIFHFSYKNCLHFGIWKYLTRRCGHIFIWVTLLPLLCFFFTDVLCKMVRKNWAFQREVRISAENITVLVQNPTAKSSAPFRPFFYKSAEN
jgi:hypothetical protein